MRDVEPPTRLFSAPRETEPPAKTSSGDTDRHAEPSAKESDKPEKPTRAKSDASRKPRLKANLPEAVQDPCLRSSDPKCYEKQKNAYVPYRGYSPSTAQDIATDSAAPVTPVGATSGAPAGGAVQGGSKAKLTPPKASDYALPPGSEASSRKPARK
jgi:hypothetical protein